MGPEINTGGGSALAYPSACHSLDWRGGLRLRHRGLARPHIQTRGQERLPVPVVFGRSENAAAATATPFDSFSSQKELAELLNETRLGFGRTIALWGFIALQQICCELDARVGVEDWVIAAECRIATCPAKSYHGSAYPRSGFRSTSFIIRFNRNQRKCFGLLFWPILKTVPSWSCHASNCYRQSACQKCGS